jgi:hypothetical protein
MHLPKGLSKKGWPKTAVKTCFGLPVDTGPYPLCPAGAGLVPQTGHSATREKSIVTKPI